MVTINRQLLIDNIERSRFDAVGIQRSALNFVRTVEASKYDIVDPTNPFVHLIEASATMAASCMSQANLLNRQQYQNSAQTMEDLYPHMSDRDHVDMHTIPSMANFIIGFDELELISRMVEVPGEDIRKIVIPRNTYVTVGETIFSLQYPIEIRQMRHEGLQVVYDVEKTTPLQTLDVNYIEPKIQIDKDGRRIIYFSMLMSQFEVTSVNETITKSKLTSIGVSFTNEYYYTRVWSQQADGEWIELATTFTDKIYPNNKATAIVRIINKTVFVEIPLYYVMTGAIASGSKIRVDVYETRGPIRLDLNGYPRDTYSVSWFAIDPKENDAYVAPLSALQTFYVYSNDITYGGKEAMAFSQIRERVLLNGSSIDNLPITPAQAQMTIQRLGFNIVKNVDNLTNRTYVATQPLPDPVNSELITPASAAINTLIEGIDTLAKLRTAYENATSLTLSPDTIYRMDSGILKALTNAEMDALASMLPERKAEVITTGGYYYTPFHYVLDTKNNQFEARPYYIDAPTLLSRSFIGENDSTLLQSSIKEIEISRSATGYRLLVINRANEAYRNLPNDKVSATLGFQADRTGDYAYIVGNVVGLDAENDRVWQFDIDLSFDIDSDDKLEVTNALMYDNTQISTRMGLSISLDLFFNTSDIMPETWRPAAFESMIGKFLLPVGTVAITRETVRFELGRSLKNLWSRASSLVSPNDYAVWDMDIYDHYATDVFKKDPVTGAGFSVVNGVLTYNYLARKGDVKIDPVTGGPLVLHYKGDIKHDANGEPIVVYGRTMKRRVDLMLIEAAYYYATNKAALDYRASLVRNMVVWITVELASIANRLLENTEINFYPTQSAGSVEVVYDNGLKKNIDASQNFIVKLYVRDSVYKDMELRAKLRSNTVRVIGEVLKARTASISNIVTAQRDSYQKDVISFDTSTFTDGLTVVTMADDSARLSIRKRLVYRDDASFALEEDVDVQFILHERPDVALEFNA